MAREGGVVPCVMALAELVAGGWPIGLTIAAAVAGERYREVRRRAALNGALHELRRPLQALVLSSGPNGGPGPHAVRVALAALGDLDRQVNGGPRRLSPRPVACRAVVQPAVERWSGMAAAARRSLVLRWRAGSAVVMVDPDRLAQALDNLIHNAMRHGGLRVSVDASVCAGGVRVVVSDSGGPVPAGPAFRDPRRGHGLRIVSAVAAEHGGRFEIRRSPAGTAAVLELPLAPEPLPVAKHGLAWARDAVPVHAHEPAVTVAPKPGDSGVEDEHVAGVMPAAA
jgi:signal transduction histidine kinase